jgi:hypothetical protein
MTPCEQQTLGRALILIYLSFRMTGPRCSNRGTAFNCQERHTTCSIGGRLSECLDVSGLAVTKTDVDRRPLGLRPFGYLTSL